MLTGWAPGLLMYAIARRYIDRTWALALLAVFITTPAVLYGGGSGQIETAAQLSLWQRCFFC